MSALDLNSFFTNMHIFSIMQYACYESVLEYTNMLTLPMCVRMLIYDDTVSASSHIYVTEYTIQWTKQEAQLCNSYRLSSTVSRSVMC